jgi:peptidase E
MKIVAIGGGEIRRLETFSIDRKIVELTGKRKPKALFLPTSQGDPDNYCDTFKRVFYSRGKLVQEQMTASRKPRPLKELIER